MATQTHCAYCFETLASNLEKRPSLSLQQVDALWRKYTTDPEDEADDTEDPTYTDTSAQTSTTTSGKPAAISRLLAPSSSSSSSLQSTSSTPPSGVSEASSATSKSSSRSSFFSRLKGGGKDTETSSGEEEEHPLFVTWNTVSKSGEKRLRGCIGTFEKQELGEGLRGYALTSAFDDTRFPPIAASELPTLECAVTLLTHFEPASNPMDWTLGTHGLRISFTYHGRRHGATYLPDVAREQGWTQEETLVSLMRKAGWSGRREEWRKVELTVVRYQGLKVALGYGEWSAWRGWVEERGED